MVICGRPDTFQYTLTNTSGSMIANDTIRFSFPTGIELAGILPSSGYSVISNGIVISSITNNASIVVRYLLRSNCFASGLGSCIPIYTCQSPAQTIYGTDYISSISLPVIQISSTKKDTIGISQGSIYTRIYSVSNSSSDAQSSLNSILYRSILQKGLTLLELKIGSTVVTPAISGDTIRYTITGNLMDADSLLHGGQSIIVSEKVRVSNICQIQNNQYSIVSVSWGCNSNTCDNKTLNASAQKGNFAPDIYFTGAIRYGSILKCSNYDTFVYKYYNRGTSTAYNIIGGSGLYSGDAKAVYSEALAESLVSFDNGTSYENTRTSARIRSNPRVALNYTQLTPLYSSGQYPPTPDSIVQTNYFTIDSLKSGDTVRVMILIRRLCPNNVSNVCGRNDQWGNSKDYISGFSYQIYETPYQDYCGVNLFNDWVPGGAPNFTNTRILANWQVALYQQPTDVLSDSLFITGIENMSNFIDVSSSTRSDNGWYYMIELGLPTSVQPRAGATKSDFWHKASSGASHGICDSFYFDGSANKLKIFFNRAKWDAGGRILRAGNIYATLVAKCSGVNSVSTSISYRGYYFNNCGSCGLNQASCVYSQPIRIHCPQRESTGGIDFKLFDYYRTQFGLEDYNDNGYPDALKKARRDSVFDRRVIPGDTIEFVMGGKIYNTTSGQYQRAFGYNTFIKTDKVRNWGSLTNFGGTLYIRTSSGSLYTTTIIPQQSTNAASDTMFFRFNFSQDSIRGKGSIPSSYSFANGDSIWIKSRYRFMDNPEHSSVYYSIIPFFVNNQLFLTSATNPNPYKTSDTANIESNDEWLGKIEVVFVYSGHRFTTWLNPNVCNNFVWSTSTWGEIAGFAPWSFSNFKNEIRPLVNIFSLYHKIPSGWELDTFAGVYLNAANGYSVPNFRMQHGFHYILDPSSQELSINLRKVLDDQYGNGFQFDEARHHNIVMGLKKCKATSANPLDNSPNGMDTFNVTYIYPDISLTGATNSLASGFTIVNTGANLTTLSSGPYQINDNEPKIGIQVIGSNSIITTAKKNTIDIKLTNERYNATYALNAQNTWLKFSTRLNSGIRVDSIQNITTGLWMKPDTLGLYRTGPLNILEERLLRVAISTPECYSQDTIDLRASYSCNCGAPVDTGYSQGSASIFLSRRLPEITLSTKAIPSDTFKLCDTIEVETVIKNSGLARIYNFGIQFKLPNFGNGLTIVPGSIKLKYPFNSASAVNLTNIKNLGSGNYRIDSIQNYFSGILNNGFSDFTDTQNSRVLLKYKMVTDCNFQSGDNIESQVFENCGYKSYLNNSIPLRLSSETRIQNNLYYTNAQYSPVVDNCKNISLNLNFINLSASTTATTASDSLYLDLPIGIKHQSSSIAPNKIERLPDGRYRLRWSVNNINPGGTKNINTTLEFERLAGFCGPNEFSLRAISSILDTCTTTGMTCNIAVLKYRHNFEIDFRKPNLVLQNVAVKSFTELNNIDIDTTTVNFTITNTGDTSMSQSLKIYFDANANGIVDATDTLLQIISISSLILPNTSYSGAHKFTSRSKYSCPLVISLDTSTNCMCNLSPSSIAVSNISLKNAGEDISICSGVVDTLGIAQANSASYQWTPTAGLSNPNSNFSKIIRMNSSGVDSTFQYVLKTTRSGGACISTDTVNLSVLSTPNTIVSNDTSICKGDSISLSALGGQTYQWSTIPVKTTSAIIERPHHSLRYFVKIFGSNGCSVLDSVMVSLDSIAIGGQNSDKVLCLNDSIKIGVPSDPTLVYSWSPSTYLSNSSNSAPTFSGVITGKFQYILSIQSTLNTCKDVDTIEVKVDSLPLADAGIDNQRINCNGDSIRLGTSYNPKYRYSWNPKANLYGFNSSNPYAKPSNSTTYYLEVVDINTGCRNQDTVLVSVVESKLIGSAVVNDLRCFNDHSGKVTIQADSGFAPYIYTLHPNGLQSSGVFSSLSGGSYSYKITDSKGCEYIDSLFINEPTEVILDLVKKTDVSCFAGSNGEAEVQTSGGIKDYKYIWSRPNDTSAIIENLLANSYTVTVSDKNGCTKSLTTTIGQPDSLQVQVLKIHNSCSGEKRGAIALVVRDGTPPYSYLWNTNESTDKIENLPSGLYECVIQDKNACSKKIKDTIQEPEKLKIDSLNVIPLKCKERPEGEIVVFASGGIGKIEYRIDSTRKFSEYNRFSDLGEGHYNVMLVDENKCRKDTVVELNSQMKFSIVAFPKDTLLGLNQKLNLGFKVLEGDSTAINSVLWQPSEGLSCADCVSPEFDAYIGNTYIVNIRYMRDCLASDTILIRIGGDQEIYIPTAFYPSSSFAENRTFKIYSNNVSFAELEIFNRWGEKVFYSKQANFLGWDGKYKNEECAPGIYSYSLRVEYLDKRRIERKGTLNLMR